MADSASHAACGQRVATQRHRWARVNERVVRDPFAVSGCLYRLFLLDHIQDRKRLLMLYTTHIHTQPVCVRCCWRGSTNRALPLLCYIHMASMSAVLEGAQQVTIVAVFDGVHSYTLYDRYGYYMIYHFLSNTTFTFQLNYCSTR